MRVFNPNNILILILGILFIGFPLYGADFSGEALIGYNGGFSLQANLVTANFAQGFPMNLQIGLAYASMDPGNALDARRIFINDATNGDPEKSGSMWNFRFDLQYQVRWL